MGENLSIAPNFGADSASERVQECKCNFMDLQLRESKRRERERERERERGGRAQESH